MNKNNLLNDKRRQFLKFLGGGLFPISASITHSAHSKSLPNISGITPSNADDLILAEGLNYDILIKWRDAINSSEYFGFNSDFIALIEDSNESATMWVNHEYVHSLLINGNKDRTKENIDNERKEVGGSILRIHKVDGSWRFVKEDPINKRIDATTPINFPNGYEVEGKTFAEGTLANCAGGQTYWGTFLSCEENYHYFYSEREHGQSKVKPSKFWYNQWEKFYNNPPEHYGWVVEIDPKSNDYKKLVGLGRFAHEGATCITTKNNKTVVYSGDDANDQCLYKFIADKPGSLDHGLLYVADINKGEWIVLEIDQQPILQKHFDSQLEVLTYTRKAAHLLGATPLARPEDIEIHPITGEVFVALTNNKPRDFHGSLIKIKEQDDYDSKNFKAEVFLTGGIDGFSCPDNIAFDKNGNLWFCSDISGRSLNKTPYKKFKNNGLFVVPAHGPQAGTVIQLGSAPNDAELTGLCFDPTQETLFLAVQHPGELTTDLKHPTSRWPDPNSLPASAVVQISGNLLTTLTQ